mmetsp:Transcript_119073/g.336788  ORF Transcript_119073/g.336788 Transcript_119073/m.336788 type:complete len:296 (+) Transcript_119073:783-1670(+)
MRLPGGIASGGSNQDVAPVGCTVHRDGGRNKCSTTAAKSNGAFFLGGAAAAINELHELVDISFRRFSRLLLVIYRRPRVDKANNPLERTTAGLVQRGAVHLVYGAQEPYRLDAHPPAVLHQSLPAIRVVDDIRGDNRDALAQINPYELLVPRLLVGASCAHRDPQRLLRRLFVRPGEELEFDVLVRAGYRPTFRWRLVPQMVGHWALHIGVSRDVVLLDGPQCEQSALVLRSLAAERECYDAMLRCHDTTLLFSAKAYGEVDETCSLCDVADATFHAISPSVESLRQCDRQSRRP